MAKICSWCFVLALILLSAGVFAQSKPLADSVKITPQNLSAGQAGNTAVNAQHIINASASSSLKIQQQQRLVIASKNIALRVLRHKLTALRQASHRDKLLNERRMQLLLAEKDRLQAKFDKQVGDQQILYQNERQKNDSRFQTFLITLLVASCIILSLIFYDQLKSRRFTQGIALLQQNFENVTNVQDRIYNIIGHDMREPINSLTTFNALLTKDGLSLNKLKMYTRELKKTLIHTATILENLLNWSNSQRKEYKPNLEACPLTGIISEALNAIEDRITEKGITVKNHIDAEIVYADKSMTGVVVKNILNNATEYVLHGGLIEVDVVENESHITLTIADNGSGMDALMVNNFNGDNYNNLNMFKPRANKAKDSSLGLVLCKTLTNIMGGKISVESSITTGTVFYVSLPRHVA